MKKALLFTLAALCVSAAQAVVTGWTSNISNVDTKGTFTAAIVVNLTAADFNKGEEYFKVLVANYRLGLGSASSDNKGRIWTGSAANGYYSHGSLQEGENILAFVFERNNSSDGQNRSLTASYYINGQFFASDAYDTYWTSNFGDYEITGFENLKDGKVYYAEGAAKTAEDYATVPEPTALALLALGVAGLALKRKVA